MTAAVVARPSWPLWISLHKADPGGSGQAQCICETAATGYMRQRLDRDAIGRGYGSLLTNVTAVEFPQFHRGEHEGEVLTHYGIGAKRGGLGLLIYSAPLDEPFTVRRLHVMRFAPGALAIAGPAMAHLLRPSQEID